MTFDNDMMRKAYRYSIKRIRERVMEGRKARIGFAVVFDSVFPMAPVFEKMTDDDLFEPFIVVIPDANRGLEHEIGQYVSTYVSLRNRYPGARIIDVYDRKSGEYSDISHECDMYCTANPYDSMTRPYFATDHFWRRHIPVIYANYGLNMARSYQRYLREAAWFGKFWRVYAENLYCLNDLKSNPHRVDAILSGYPKMDALAGQREIGRNRKKILVAPHHSVQKGLCSVNFGNFLRLADFFLDLPLRYPGIDFVFRPHPLLFVNLEKESVWGAEKAADYWRKLERIPNAELQRGGDYLHTFANSDALIHDCGSFSGEYLYTGKPCCRIISRDADIDGEYSEFGKKCMDCHYLAHDEREILRFMDETVIGNHDPKKELRRKFRDQIAVNYPESAKFIVDDIRKEILES